MINSASLLAAFAYGNLAGYLGYTIQIEPGNKVVNLGENRVFMSFSPSTGVYKGTLLDPVMNKKWSFGGVVLQNDSTGYGFLTGTNKSSQVVLVPN